jgi:hypothetical protein
LTERDEQSGRIPLPNLCYGLSDDGRVPLAIAHVRCYRRTQLRVKWLIGKLAVVWRIAIEQSWFTSALAMQKGKPSVRMAKYQRVLKDFVDQSKLAAQSRTLLATTYSVTPAGSPTAGNQSDRAKFEQLMEAQKQEQAKIAAARARYRATPHRASRRLHGLNSPTSRLKYEKICIPLAFRPYAPCRSDCTQDTEVRHRHNGMLQGNRWRRPMAQFKILSNASH